MERLFPRALVACIGEGRQPDYQEPSIMADEVGRDAFANCLSRGERRQAMNIARTALAGQQLAA